MEEDKELKALIKALEDRALKEKAKTPVVEPQAELNPFDALLGTKIKLEKEITLRKDILAKCEIEIPIVLDRIQRAKDLLMFLRDTEEIIKRKETPVVSLPEYIEVISLIEQNEETLSTMNRELTKGQTLKSNVTRVLSNLEAQLKMTMKKINSYGKVIPFNDKQRSKEKASE